MRRPGLVETGQGTVTRDNGIFPMLAYEVWMYSSEQIHQAENALHSIFYGIDAQVKKNLERILNALRSHRLGPHHFASVSGYGHDDLGRHVLDQVFAELMAL